MKKTEHYQLSQWEYPDRILMSDFNADNAKIDAALASEAAERKSTLAAGLALHPSAELLRGGVLEADTSKVELDVSTLDWGRYFMVILELDRGLKTTPALSDTYIRLGLARECCVLSNSGSASYEDAAFRGYRCTSVCLMIPVLYNPQRRPQFVGFGAGWQETSRQCAVTGGAAAAPLADCKKITATGGFYAGDIARLWGVK